MRFNSDLSEAGNINFDIEVTCVAADSAVVHLHKVLLGDNTAAAGNRYEEVAYLSSLVHRHYTESVHNGFHSSDRINLGNYDLRTEPLCAHGNALAAPAISCDNNIFSGNYEVRSAVDAVPYRLTCSVAVIEEMLAVGVIYKHHRKFEFASLVHGFEADYAGSCFFTAAYNIRDKIRTLAVDTVNKVAAVIDYDVRTAFYHL